MLTRRSLLVSGLVGAAVMGTTQLAGAAPAPTFTTVVFGGAIRNLGDGKGWQPINDPPHRPVGIEAVETYPDRLVIRLSDLGQTAIGTATINVDETLARAGGFSFGPSVGLDQVIIYGSRLLVPVDFTKLSAAAFPGSNLWIRVEHYADQPNTLTANRIAANR